MFLDESIMNIHNISFYEEIKHIFYQTIIEVTFLSFIFLQNANISWVLIFAQLYQWMWKALLMPTVPETKTDNSLKTPKSFPKK